MSGGLIVFRMYSGSNFPQNTLLNPWFFLFLSACLFPFMFFLVPLVGAAVLCLRGHWVRQGKGWPWGPKLAHSRLVGKFRIGEVKQLFFEGWTISSQTAGVGSTSSSPKWSAFESNNSKEKSDVIFLPIVWRGNRLVIRAIFGRYGLQYPNRSQFWSRWTITIHPKGPGPWRFYPKSSNWSWEHQRTEGRFGHCSANQPGAFLG